MARAAFVFTPETLDRLLQVLEQRFREPSLRLRDLAAQVGVSETTLSHRFKQAMGEPPHAYITGLRMKRARNLLEKTSLPLGEIARQVGYRYQAHFSVAFRLAHGTSPLTYRSRSLRNARRSQLRAQRRIHEPDRQAAGKTIERGTRA
jgi:transcriptional regulator GlxA family with amidase domain